MFWNFLASSKKTTRTPCLSKQAGFGLIELMVSIGILTLVMGMILVQQNAFNGAVLLRNQVYEIAFDAREVQLSAIGAVSGVTATNFRSSRGMYFDPATSPKEYTIYQDLDGDAKYDAGESSGLLQGKLDNRFEIEEVREAGGAAFGTGVSVIFQRPNFDALFYNSAGTQINVAAIEIVVRRIGTTGTGPGDVRTLEITSTGQIAVQ